jgi:hypothetical protein
MLRDEVFAAWLDAHSFLLRFAVHSRGDILPEQWIASYGIEIVEAPLDGACAQLIRLADHTQIVLPERIADHGARRFALMHELYHYLKKHPSPSPTMMCKPKSARRGDKALSVHEIGSNAFAAATLLPEYLLRKRCEVSPVSLHVPAQIAKEFDVSILTSAIRFTELTSECCAAVLSRDGVVEWASESPTFSYRIAKGTRLARESVAWDFHATGRLDEREQPVPAYAWIDTATDVDIVEHSICSREHRTVLSLVWIPDAVAARVGMA